MISGACGFSAHRSILEDCSAHRSLVWRSWLEASNRFERMAPHLVGRPASVDGFPATPTAPRWDRLTSGAAWGPCGGAVKPPLARAGPRSMGAMSDSRTPRRPPAASDPRLEALAEDSGYEVLGRIGTGGMGIVYRAHDADGNDVAIKMLRHEIADDP